MLQAQGAQTCQRLLTLFQIRKVGVWGGVLHGRERRVDLERLGDGLGAYGSELVAAEAANEGGTKVSAAADGAGRAAGGRRT